MATASMSMTVTETSSPVVVPDDDVARLMYYLHCVTVSLGLDILEDDLVDYKNYRWLSHVRTELVFKSALWFSPDEFIDKLIFRDDDQIVTRTSSNKFCEVSVACDIVSLQRDVIIAGQVQNVTKVMFFKSSWLKTYYTHPLLRTVLKAKHCVHCKGMDGTCICDDCPRTSDSQCQPLLNLLIDSLRSTTISSPPLSSVTAIPTQSSNSHQCICDGCGSQTFQGTRYRCKVCDDYDLCRSCYVGNVHNLSH
jgi:Zinc finger, ZZ type